MFVYIGILINNHDSATAYTLIDVGLENSILAPFALMKLLEIHWLRIRNFYLKPVCGLLLPLV